MTTKSGMNPVHPGEVLREELDDLGLSANALAKAIDVPANRVTAILNGERGVTADTALRLGRYFDTTAQFWLNLQQAWQIRRAQIDAGAHVQQHVVPLRTKALQIAAGQATHSSAQAASVLRTISRNVAFCDQLNAVERSIGILASNQQRLHGLEGPLYELGHAGIFDILGRQLQFTGQWFTQYQGRFRWADGSYLSRLAAQLSLQTSTIERLAAMKNPWLNVEDRLGSVNRLSRLYQIGGLIGGQSAFAESVAAQVRTSFGDGVLPSPGRTTSGETWVRVPISTRT